MRLSIASRLALAMSASFLTLAFAACCCPPIPVGNNPNPPPKVVVDRDPPDVAKGPGGAPAVQLMDPGPPPPEEGPVPSLAVQGAKGAAAYDRYPEPWRGRFVKDHQDRVAAARRDLETTAAKYKADLAAAEKELKAEKDHIQQLKELNVMVDRSKQLAAATDRLRQLKELREEDVTRPVRERLKACEVNDPPYFASRQDKLDAEFAALPAAEQERRKDLRRRMADWVVKKREADEHNRNVEEATAVPQLHPLDKGVTMSITATELAGRRVRVNGTTNLPAGTGLGVSVKERVRDGFFGQAKCVVKGDGSFEAGPFGPAQGLKEGGYVADVTMPDAQLQPADVRRVIGNNGEKLTGPLVEKDEFGVTISKSADFTVGGPGAEQQQRDRAKARAKEYRGWLDKVEALQKRLEAARAQDLLRDPKNMAKLAKWGEFARQFAKDHKGYVDEIGKLDSLPARLTILAPLTDLNVMFLATAERNDPDFREASEVYAESLMDLKEFLKQAESP